MDAFEQIARLKEKFNQPLPGLDAQNRMASRVRPLPDKIPADARDSAVLALLYPHDESLAILLIKRIDDGKAHSGQISFPGGRKDPEDIDLAATALRETNEEVGIMTSQIEVLGGLTSLYIPVSNSQVHPYVGFAAQKQHYILSPGEVQYTLDVPTRELFDNNKKIVTHITPAAFPTITLKAPAYKLDEDHLVWGATAMILSELEAMFESIA